ncbi:hypothetical protein OHA72_58745 [Dactylosporangium sp. NBC_01737]|uniref:hypothetical protein n=1 Tax=Dactylosporangium sp. NBC_01737 TaxID=2975959 RepID=UPI002E0E3498|nr:hypothetical protein OHA72_58745 [Dactylosporangium sp. NBC_01737]
MLHGMAVLRGLLVLQGAFGLTSTLGVLTLMGFNPVYAVAPVAHAALLMTLGALLERRRWALVTTIVAEVLAVAGWQLQLALGLLPQLDFTVNLTGLLTTLALPVTVLVLCARRVTARA